MGIWKAELLGFGLSLLGNPGSLVEGIASAVLATMAFVLVLGAVGGVLGCAMTETGRTTALFAVTGLAVILGAAIGSVLLVPRIDVGIIQMAVPWATAALLVLVPTVPIGCFLLKGKYAQTLASLITGMAAFAIVVALVHTGFNLARAGGSNLEKARDAQQERTQLIR